MTKTIKATLLASAMTLGLTTAAHADHVAYSLDQDGAALVSFGPSDGSNAMSSSITLDGSPISLDALTYRPQTGQLYGYDGSSGTLYTVDPATGAATFEFQSDDLPDGFTAFDTNTNLDAFRFVNADGANVVYFPADTANADPMNAGRLITDAPTINSLTYADGYSETGAPSVIGNGYTDQVPGGAAAPGGDGELIQYVLDADTDTLATLDNNAGTIDFVADAGFDFDIAGGFDVFTTPDGTEIGYALLTVDGDQSFYEIDLGTFSIINSFGIEDQFGELSSLAVFLPMADAVPVPAAALLFLTGAGGFAAARKRKARA